MDGQLTGPYLVLGAGRAGLSAAGALRATAGGAAVRVWDAFDGAETRRRRDTLARDGVALELGAWRTALLDGAATVVKSPGVPGDAAPVREALARGLTVVDELELGVRRSRRELVAVTGTDGKTTVCALIARAAAGAGPDLLVAGNTESGPPLSAAPATGGSVVVEASSYQLEFCGGPFAGVAVLTNVSAEHLHRHGTLAAYAAAKRRLFLGPDCAVPRAVVGADEPFGRALAADLRAAGSAVTTVGSTAGADYRVVGVESHDDGAVVRVRCDGEELTVASRQPGRHNAENLLAALAACEHLGVARAEAIERLRTSPGVPGRWEHVRAGQPFDLIVDFAHTPAGLTALLHTARAVVDRRGGGRVHVLLSAGSIMSADKRREYGRVAGTLGDRVIPTEGSWADVPQPEIVALLAEGAGDTGATIEPEPDRGAAIRRLLVGAAPGDVALIVGRGSRTWLTRDPAGGGVPFDDRVVARAELERLGAVATSG